MCPTLLVRNGLAGIFLALAAACAPMQAEPVTKAPHRDVIVIAHRGASGERPEHTLAAYTLAIEQGADFIEPDLVMTKDGVPVARHENEIGGTTDVANRPEFADRKTTKTIDGVAVTGWFTEDFTLAELRTLRARERLPAMRPQNTRFDGQFSIPTLDEIIALAKAKSAELGRPIGIYPETKHPSYFASLGLDIGAALVRALDAAGWRTAAAPVFIQSFEVGNLKRLKTMTGVRLIQLVASTGGPADLPGTSYAQMLTPAGLRAIAAYASGIGPEKVLAVAPDGTVTPLVANAHAAGLAVHPWTFRIENAFLPPDLRDGADPAAHGRIADEIARHISAGVDGFFTDNPYQGVRARDAASRRPMR